MNNSGSHRLFRSAGWLLIVLFSVTIIFHFIIIFGVIDFRYVWGGRLKTTEEMSVFESISILLNSLFLWVVLQRMGATKMLFPHWLLNTFLVVMVVIFALNTLGNLLAKETVESWVFTPLTFISSVASALLVGKKRA